MQSWKDLKKVNMDGDRHSSIELNTCLLCTCNQCTF